MRSSEQAFNFFLAVVLGAFSSFAFPVVEQGGGIELLAAESESQEGGDGAVDGAAEQQHIADADGAHRGDVGNDDMPDDLFGFIESGEAHQRTVALEHQTVITRDQADAYEDVHLVERGHVRRVPQATLLPQPCLNH